MEVAGIILEFDLCSKFNAKNDIKVDQLDLETFIEIFYFFECVELGIHSVKLIKNIQKVNLTKKQPRHSSTNYN